MKSREQRERELIDSGLVDSVKAQFRNVNHNISDKYFILMADYIDSIAEMAKDKGYMLKIDSINRNSGTEYMLTKFEPQDLSDDTLPLDELL